MSPMSYQTAPPRSKILMVSAIRFRVNSADEVGPTRLFRGCAPASHTVILQVVSGSPNPETALETGGVRDGRETTGRRRSRPG